MRETSSGPSVEPPAGTSRIRTGRGVLFRMVAGHVLIGMLVLIAILVSIWQLNTYNTARQTWIDTQESLNLISNARKDSTVLILVVYRVVLTQEPFRNMEPETKGNASETISVRIDDLEGWQKRLEEEASSLPAGNPKKAQLMRALDTMNELISIATQSRDMVKEKNWEAARILIEEKPPDSDMLKFDRIHVDLLAELRMAQILIQQDAVMAEDQMGQASTTAIGVTVSVVVLVILLGITLSITIIRNITTPITELSSAATQLASGDFSVHVPATRQDEFGHLAQVFNDMAAKLGEIYAGMHQQIRELRIVIDETLQKEKFIEIVETDYFKQLTKEGEKLRDIMNS